MRLATISGALFAFIIAGCAVSADPVESADNEEISASESAIKLSKLSTVPAYFGIDNIFAVSSEVPWVYAKFTTLPGRLIDVSVGLEEEGASVGFKLYRVLPNDKLKLVETVDGPTGEALLSFKSKGTGIYVIEMATSASQGSLVLRLGCDADTCSPDPQPGSVCGGLHGIACDAGLYCDFPLKAICGAADATGTCAVKPQACTKEYMPVCGCDDQTYGNACEAASAGVSVAQKGACGAPVDSGAKEGELCGGFAGIACAEDLFCAFPTETNCGSGDQGGVCAKKPGACAQIYDPVCGCDGQTYGNACNAASAGVSVARDGECSPIAGEGESCGGFRATPSPVCGEGLFCAYAMEDTCGWADAAGTCAPKPEACTRIYNPVCGCDGQTYGNACEAASNGVSVVSEGECQAL